MAASLIGMKDVTVVVKEAMGGAVVVDCRPPGA